MCFCRSEHQTERNTASFLDICPFPSAIIRVTCFSFVLIVNATFLLHHPVSSHLCLRGFSFSRPSASFLVIELCSFLSLELGLSCAAFFVRNSRPPTGTQNQSVFYEPGMASPFFFFSPPPHFPTADIRFPVEDFTKNHQAQRAGNAPMAYGLQVVHRPYFPFFLPQGCFSSFQVFAPDPSLFLFFPSAAIFSTQLRTSPGFYFPFF